MYGSLGKAGLRRKDAAAFVYVCMYVCMYVCVSVCACKCKKKENRRFMILFVWQKKKKGQARQCVGVQVTNTGRVVYAHLKTNKKKRRKAVQVCIISLTKAVKKDALNDNATLDPQRQTSMDNKRAEGRKLRNTQKRKNTRQCRIGLKKKKRVVYINDEEKGEWRLQGQKACRSCWRTAFDDQSKKKKQLFTRASRSAHEQALTYKFFVLTSFFFF